MQTIAYLLSVGADPTGRDKSGSDLALEQQAGIIQLLLERGANSADRNGRGQSVAEVVTSERIRGLLN